MSDVFSRIWQVMETDPGNRGLTTDLPRADLKEMGFSLLNAGEVFVISGFPVQRAGGKGETDGPIGTANLAAVLEQIGKKVTVVTDEPSCEAMLAACETLPVEQCADRILASPSVGCPPAVPIVICGERISWQALDAFSYYGITHCTVVAE